MNVFTSFDGVRIAYHDEGEGPAVVLLHGYGLDGLSNFGDVGRSLPMLERMSELCRAELGVAPPLPAPAREGRPGLIPVLLAAGSRVIIPDMRGFGASDKPRDEAAYANAAMARDVLALIGFLGLDAVDVLGHSMGSITAAKLLALGAPEVRSAILAGTGDYLLAGVELEFPESWPVPDSMPRPFTLEVSAAERARVLAAGKVERGNLASLEVIAVRAARCRPARPHGRSSGRHRGCPDPGSADGHRAGSRAERKSGSRQPEDRAAPRRDSNRVIVGVRRRPPVDALGADIPSISSCVLRATVAGRP